MVVWEGTRPLLVEIQALVDPLDDGGTQTRGGRSGTKPSGLILLALYGGLQMSGSGTSSSARGRRREVTEPARIFETLLAMVSACVTRRCRRISGGVLASGAGEAEIRCRRAGRISEGGERGFRRAIVPAANVPKKSHRRNAGVRC